MRTIRCHLSALLLSTLVASAQSLPPLPPGLPPAMAKPAEPTRVLTDQEKAARKAAAAETAKAVADMRARALAEFERYRHEPLKDAAGQPVSKTAQQAERKARLEALAREGALQHARDSAEVDAWLRRQGHARPELVRPRPVRLENGRPVYLQSRNLGSAKMLRTDKVWPGGSLSLNLDGTGVTLGLWESFYPETNHVEFAGRI